MSDTIIVTGTIDLDPANRGAFIEAAGKLMELTRAEDGCERYVFAADLADEGRFHVTEQWASADAMGAHLATPHLAEFLGLMGSLGVTGASLTKWEGATGAPLM